MSAVELQEVILDLQGEHDAKKKEIEGIYAKLEEAKSKLLAYMVENKLESFKTDRGTISLNRKFQVTVPKGDDLQAFFDYLGSTDPDTAASLRTVNYMTLNSWYKETLEAAGDEAPFLKIPGLKPPTANEYLSVRRK